MTEQPHGSELEKSDDESVLPSDNHSLIQRALKTIKKHKYLIMAALVLLPLGFKIMFYDGVLTCKPMKYRGTIIGVLLGYNNVEKLSPAERFDRVIPIGMPAQELLDLLKEQGFEPHIGHFYYDIPYPRPDAVTVSRNNYYRTEVLEPDYVIAFSVKFTCIYGDYLPSFAVWIKDDKVYKTKFKVDRSFI